MSRLLTNRFIHTLVLLGLLAMTILLRMQDYDWNKSLRFLAFDAYNNIQTRPQSDDVVIVDIDETSFSHEELGQWPWSRDVLGKLVGNLQEMGARAVVFDMVFPEYDRTSPKALVKRQSEDVREQLQGIVSQLPDNDQVFADVIERAGNVVTAFIWSSQEEATRRRPVLKQPILLSKVARGLMDTASPMVGVVTNIPELSNAAAGNGSFGVSPDVDGIIRRVPLLFSFRGKENEPGILYPSLAMEALRVSQGAKTLIKIRSLKPEETGPFDSPLVMNIGEYEIPLDWDANFFVYFSQARPEKYIPAWEVIQNEVEPDKIRDKIVFVGTSAEGLKDIRSTPVDLYIPGVEVHVNVVEQVLSGDYLLRPNLIEGVELIFIAMIGLLVILLAPFVGAVIMAFFTLTLTGAVFAASWSAFNEYGLLLDPVYPSLSILSLFVISSLLSYIRTEAERKQVKEAFGLYISPDFMNELTKHPDKLKLGGETRDLTVMFTDIRSFTSISESMTPEALIQMMNNFLTPMSDLVMENRGTIDKYMGDAMMAFWNAPLDDEHHARNACLTALKMNKALEPINEKIIENAEKEGKTPALLEAGIGINTGRASVGNMGSRQRFAYSALGDTVNLASRLEGQTKQYGVRILIGEGTRERVPELATLELDLIRVKGKAEPERIYVLLGTEEMKETDYFKSWEKKHNDMLAAYRDMKWDKAIGLAEDCQNISKEGMTGYYDMLLLRLNEMKDNPPEKGWDGVFIATTK